MTRPILRPVLAANGQVMHFERIGFDYRAEHAHRGTPPRYRRNTAGTSPRRRFATVAIRP